MNSDIMFHNNLSSAIQVVLHGRTDMMKKILAFHNSALSTFNDKYVSWCLSTEIAWNNWNAFSVNYNAIISNI